MVSAALAKRNRIARSGEENAFAGNSKKCFGWLVRNYARVHSAEVIHVSVSRYRNIGSLFFCDPRRCCADMECAQGCLTCINSASLHRKGTQP